MKKLILLTGIFALGIGLVNCKKKNENTSPAVTEEPTPSPVTYFYKWIYLDSINSGNILMNKRDSLKVGLVTNKLYVFSLLHCSDRNIKLKAALNPDLNSPIYNGNSFDSIVPTEFFNLVTSNIMYMNVDGTSMTTAQSKYKLMVHEALDTSNQVNMGTKWAPVQLTGKGPHIGTVETLGESFFEISGLAPNTPHWISLYTMTADADLFIYSDNTYSFPYTPTLMHTDVGGSPEQYKFSSNASGKLFIKVRSGELNYYGSTFRVLVGPVN